MEFEGRGAAEGGGTGGLIEVIEPLSCLVVVTWA